MTYIVLGQGAAVMGTMELAFHPVQDDRQPRTMSALKLRAQVIQQGFDLPPVEVAADRLREDRFEDFLVFVTHGCPVSRGDDTRFPNISLPGALAHREDRHASVV